MGEADDGLRIGKRELPVLTRPRGGGIAETSNSNPVRQATFDGGLDQIGCEKSQRDRHVDFADAAFFPGGDLLDTGDGPGKDFLEPSPATGDRSDELGAGLRGEALGGQRSRC